MFSISGEIGKDPWPPEGVDPLCTWEPLARREAPGRRAEDRREEGARRHDVARREVRSSSTSWSLTSCAPLRAPAAVAEHAGSGRGGGHAARVQDVERLGDTEPLPPRSSRRSRRRGRRDVGLPPVARPVAATVTPPPTSLPRKSTERGVSACFGARIGVGLPAEQRRVEGLGALQVRRRHVDRARSPAGIRFLSTSGSSFFRLRWIGRYRSALVRAVARAAAPCALFEPGDENSPETELA